MPDLCEDRSLLEGFRRGDRRALEQVYRGHVQEVARLLRNGFGFGSSGARYRFQGYRQPFDLESAVQEVFSRAFEERARLAYDGLSPYAPYLHAIARNCVISELRRRVVVLEPEQHEERAGPAEAPDAEAALLDREVVRLLAEFAGGLAGIDRAVFELRLQDELTQEEAARRAGVSRMKLRRTEARLRRRLVAYLQRHGYLEGRAGRVLDVLCLL